MPVSIEELGVDMLTIAGHKLYAPKGVGALFVREGIALEPVLHGADHEGGVRAGTENTAYVAGLGEACSMAAKAIDKAYEHMENLRDRLHRKIQSEIDVELRVNSGEVDRLPNTLSLVFPFTTGYDLLQAVPEICASTGSACHSGIGDMSSTLQAMGLSTEEASGTVRLSVGWYSSEEEIDRAAGLIVGAWEGLQIRQ